MYLLAITNWGHLVSSFTSREAKMVCPRCKNENVDTAVFCIHCGYDLHQTTKAANLSSGAYFLLMTIRFVIAIFAVWVLKEILVNLSFVKDLVIPNFPLTIITMINLVFLTIMIMLIVGFAGLLVRMWPKVFPKFVEAGRAINIILYLIILSVVYDALRPVFASVFGTSTALLILQIVLVAVALILVFLVGIILYRSLPAWLNYLRQSMMVTTSYENPTIPQ
jgi:hypothetical protein